MPNVLVVDDVAVDRRLAGGLIEKAPNINIQYAENGAEALARMHIATPDLLVTDLQMPRVDGLELVAKVRMIYPKVPVILMTAKGSETTALEALEQGATGYVPKSQLNEMLLDTVEEALALAGADRTYSRLMECQQRIEFQYELNNDAALVYALVDLIQQIVGGMGLTDHTGKFRIGVAFREAMLNALYRGNLEIGIDDLHACRERLLDGQEVALVEERRQEPPYRDRKIRVEVNIDRQQARFVIADDGPGFDHAAAIQSGDPSALGAFDEKQGRGLVLMRSLMDEVSYNQQGNEVTLVKRRDP